MRKLVLPVVCLCALLLPYYGGETRDVAYRSGGGGGFRKRGGGGGGTGVSSLSRAAEEGGNGDVEAAKAWLLEYDVEAEKVYYAFVSASWKYNTDITPENAAEEIAQSLIAAEFDNEMAISANEFDWKNFDDEKVKREFSKITDIGYAALEPEKVEE
ncbi:PREDICTED: angiotensin-converting enzyme-like, partial [Priapulus caudatus]|uniref:Angiotensin-converting enzyme-like n=1 Tax=Priapulus caudatus TaxID=37621 RepID=A0ABM1EUD5_PRICU